MFPIRDVSPFVSPYLTAGVFIFFCIGRPTTDLTVARRRDGNALDVRDSMLCPLYMAEISPPEFRGALMAMEQFSIVLGCVLGFWAGFFTRGGMSFNFTLTYLRRARHSPCPFPPYHSIFRRGES